MTPPEPTDTQDIELEPRQKRGLRWFVEVVGLLPPRDAEDPYAHRRGEPRGFAVLWLCFLLLSSGIVYTSVGSPSLASAEGYRFASKVLMTVVAVGIVVFWPMLRLSQPSPYSGGPSATLRDLVVVLIPVQAFYWPQVLLTGWTIDAIALAALIVFAWALITGAVIALAIGPATERAKAYSDGHSALAAAHHGPGRLQRVLWMLALVLSVLVAPLLSISLGPIEPPESGIGIAGVLAMSSPLTAPWEILTDRVWTGSRAAVQPGQWRIAVLWTIAGFAAWAVALILTRRDPVAPVRAQA